jgi:hypothetical protein
VTAVVEGVFVENEIDLPAPPELPATDSASAIIHTPSPGVTSFPKSSGYSRYRG